MNLLSNSELLELRLTVREAAQQVYGLYSFDCALPSRVQSLLASKSFDPWGNYVFWYDTSRDGILIPLCLEAKDRMLEVGLPFIPSRAVAFPWKDKFYSAHCNCESEFKLNGTICPDFAVSCSECGMFPWIIPGEGEYQGR
jgi:hypothetical protein